MIASSDLKEIVPKPQGAVPAAAQVHTGVPIPKQARVMTFSPAQWEQFVEEWAQSQTNHYHQVRRFAGAGDYGVDIAGFTGSDGFSGEWDNFQCKHYASALAPSDIWVELGKVIYYSFRREYKPPRRYFFMCPKGVGTSLTRLMTQPSKLKAELKANWPKHCQMHITSTQPVVLDGQLLAYIDNFDFTIFCSKSIADLITDHSKTPFHAVLFGGGLPERPPSTAPPAAPSDGESRYVGQLFLAYGEHAGASINSADDLAPHGTLSDDFLRQRERFYHAEALRNFARDTVPEGTFAALQDEVFHGVVDVAEGSHPNGYARMKATVSQAAQLNITANPLAPATKVQDRQGICHQLVNDDRLRWVNGHG
jgi:hypothetical protein